MQAFAITQAERKQTAATPSRINNLHAKQNQINIKTLLIYFINFISSTNSE